MFYEISRGVRTGKVLHSLDENVWGFSRAGTFNEIGDLIGVLRSWREEKLGRKLTCECVVGIYEIPPAASPKGDFSFKYVLITCYYLGYIISASLLGVVSNPRTLWPSVHPSALPCSLPVVISR